MLGSAFIRSTDDTGTACWLRFAEPARILAAHQLDAVIPTIQEAETNANAGYWVVAFVAYEAAPAFDPALVVGAPVEGLPLAWFALYEQAEVVYALPTWQMPPPICWHRSIEPQDFIQNIQSIHGLIGAGDTYQVNFTFRLRATITTQPLSLFSALYEAQQTDHAAYLDLGRFAICSGSPELFFERNRNRLTCRPMKGTAPRGKSPTHDDELANALAGDTKNRAENLMIVDMMRNDLGHVADLGTVQVERLFEVERYETLHQMVSVVSAQTEASLTEIFCALFPAASITGAPKIRTMEIIRNLEESPRGAYTGCIGHIAPGGDCRFNVAIRTALIDRESSEATYGIGSGIVWDSDPESEWEECLLKAETLLSIGYDQFALFETFAWLPDRGFVNLDRHLARLKASLAHFGIEYDFETAQSSLNQINKLEPQRVRLQVNKHGQVKITSAPLEGPPSEFQSKPQPTPRRIGIAKTPVDSSQMLLRHKTNRRDVYERARCERPDCDDVILWNEANEVTETTIANLVVELDGEWVTPPVSSGLLPGIGRAILLEQGLIQEKRVRLDDLKKASGFATVSSLRGWCLAVLDQDTHP